MIRIIVFLFVISFLGFGNIYSEPTKQSRGNYKKTAKKVAKKGNATKSPEENKQTISREDSRFFHDNTVLEEVLFPSNTSLTEKVTTNIPAKTENKTQTISSPVKTSSVNTEKSGGGIIDFLIENKKAIIVSIVILIFALYRLRSGGSSRDLGSSPRMFSRLKDK